MQKVAIRYYEPKLVPELDRDGNVVRYTNPSACPCSLKDSDFIREKPWPSQKGLSCNPNNVTGFRALIDLINQNRNLGGMGYIPLGADDAASLTAIRDAEQYLKQNESSK